VLHCVIEFGSESIVVFLDNSSRVVGKKMVFRNLLVCMLFATRTDYRKLAFTFYYFNLHEDVVSEKREHLLLCNFRHFNVELLS
jgi:hypothetical protein